MKGFTNILFFLFFFSLISCSTFKSERFITAQFKCKMTIGDGFEKKVTDRYHTDFITYTRNNTERLFVTIGTSDFEVNLPTEEYTGDNNYWWFYKVYDSITLEGVHNGLYWKQVKFYKDLKPSIGYDGIPKEKVPEFENYLNSFSCKKR